MILSPMMYKGYVWPHNPKTYSVTFENVVNSRKIPYGEYVIQNMGKTHRVFKGEGEFAGAGAYEQFRLLEKVFEDTSPGILVHPVWSASQAYFVKLELTEKPRRDYVSYSFEFWEAKPQETALKDAGTAVSADASVSAGATPARYYTVVSGDTLWDIGQRNSLTVDQILSLNPDIKNPNLLYPGDKVRLA